jgi:hypothetical protein
MKNDDGKPLDWLDQKRLVGVAVVITCNRCRHDYTPNDKDISLNANLYYKMCKCCRAYCLASKIRRENRKSLRLLPTNT